jgi:glycosyltransferase involved in cell wall biosynthesis
MMAKVTGENLPFEPQISVGMPVYNGEKYLTEAIESILAQSFSPFELIISDNASTDQTDEICRAYASKDNRIKYVRHEVNIGGPRNWNFVFTLSKGKYFKWASANDLCAQDLIEKCKAILDEHEDVALCYSRTRLIDEQGKVIEDYEDTLDLQSPDPYNRFIALLSNLRLNNPQGGLFRSSVLKRTKLERLYPGGDIPLMAEVALFGKFYEVPEFLFFRRMSSDASTVGKTLAEIGEFFDPGQRKLYFPFWQMYLEFFKIILKASIKTNTKLSLLFFMAKSLYWSRHILVQDLGKSSRSA